MAKLAEKDDVANLGSIIWATKVWSSRISSALIREST